MGSPLSGIISEIYINNFKKLVVNKNNKIFTKHILECHRYCNDVFVIWNGNNAILHALLNIMNIICNLVITGEPSNNCVSFDINRKPTTTDCIIPFNSLHTLSTNNLDFNLISVGFLATLYQ